MRNNRDHLPMPNSQPPGSNAFGIGSWKLGLDVSPSWLGSASKVRIFATTLAAVVIGGSARLMACPVCFGAEETPMIDGAKLGVIVLLAVTLAVQGGFVGFFLYLRKRARRIAELDLDTEWSKLQDASRPS